MKKILNLFLALSLIGIMASCIKTDDLKPTPDSKVVAIVIDPASTTIEVEKTQQLKAIVLPIELSNKVVWETTDSKIVTVSEKGLITGIKEGSAIVSAKGDNITATCKVTVTKKPADIPRLDEIFSGKLTVIENTTGGWWTDVLVPNFTCEFEEEIEKGIFVFNMKGFWYAQMEGADANNWAQNGDQVKYYSIPVIINVQDPENPTYTVTHPDDSDAHCILTVNEGVQDKAWWVGFEPVKNKKIQINYDRKEMTFHYNVSAGENGKWNLNYDFILSMSWE